MAVDTREGRVAKILAAQCKLCSAFAVTGGPVRSSTPGGQKATRLLAKLAALLEQEILHTYSGRYKATWSRGRGNLPKILWVGVVPAGRSVSDCWSVTTCYGSKGEGIVAGLMVPLVFPLGEARLVHRTTGSMLVDVDGPTPSASYNDKFLNPLEITAENIQGKDYLKHISNSLILLEQMRSTKL